MNRSGLKEPGFENRRTFSKKAREPYLAFKKLRLSAFTNHGQLKKCSSSLKIKNASEKAIFMMNVSNKLKVSEINYRSKAITRTIALSLKFNI